MSSTACGKVTGTTQSGSPRISGQSGNSLNDFSVKATNFKSTKYNVTFLNPTQVSSGISCHRTPATVLSSKTGKSSFLGPKFYAEFNLPASGPGLAKICSQDMPDVVVGQVINFTVV